MIVATLICLFTTFVAVRLSLLYPEQTFIQYTQSILGKWLGKIILVPYFLMWVFVTGIILREYADFVNAALFISTPLWIVILIMLGAIVYVTYSGGLRSISRCSEIIGPISVLSGIVVILLSVKDWNWLRILPVYSNSGLLPIVKGGLISCHLPSRILYGGHVNRFYDQTRASSSLFFSRGCSRFIRRFGHDIVHHYGLRAEFAG